MKRFLPFLLLLLAASPASATTWYATSSSVNIDTASLWVPTSTGSCTGSGTALVWGSQANGDVFDANGCTALAVDVDPGVATGASAGVCGAVTVEVTLETDATNGGAFTYATATNLVIHANITATKTTALGISGSTNGGTICGNVTGGSTGSQLGVSDGHTLVTVYLIGNITGGSGSGAYGYDLAGNTPLNIKGNASAGGAHGLYSGASGSATMAGNCVGSDTAVAMGCYFGGTGVLTLTGSIINGKRDIGAGGAVYFTPSATNYILSPKDSSYVLGTIDAHATETPTDPGVSNVKSGVAYGSFTGTLVSGGAAACAIGGW